MLPLLATELRRVREKNEVDAGFISQAADFFRIYADRTHHGKEEDILFRDLARKPLSSEHKKLMDELIQEHRVSRKTVGELVTAMRDFGSGNSNALEAVATSIERLLKLYPEHIQKEDKRFFYPTMEYFDRQEQDKMLQEFYEFDRKIIHEKYEAVVTGLEKEAK